MNIILKLPTHAPEYRTNLNRPDRRTIIFLCFLAPKALGLVIRNLYRNVKFEITNLPANRLNYSVTQKIFFYFIKTMRKPTLIFRRISPRNFSAADVAAEIRDSVEVMQIRVSRLSPPWLRASHLRCPSLLDGHYPTCDSMLDFLHHSKWIAPRRSSSREQKMHASLRIRPWQSI